MATRAVIARTTGDGWAGVYHHWDGYPSGLGVTLNQLAQPEGPFGGDLERMMRTLIDEHPAGWSNIEDIDWSQPAGFREAGFESKGPECYCHGGRHEKAHPIRSWDEDWWGTEYAYAVNERTGKMFVYEFRWSSNDWVLAGEVDLRDAATAAWMAVA